MTLRALSPAWERKTSEVMPSDVGVQLRYEPMRMPELDWVRAGENVGECEGGGEEVGALG